MGLDLWPLGMGGDGMDGVGRRRAGAVGLRARQIMTMRL